MKFIADFHIHSHFSLATSKNLTPQFLDYWARLKGISVIGTGDFTHPGWTNELKELLELAEVGLYKLKNKFHTKELSTPFLPPQETRFILTAEISCIYKKNGKVRKVHNVVFAPDFESVEKIQQKLNSMDANITSDGRPILGLDSRDLLEICLEASESIFFVPAHIWTPWFSALGSKSGFNSIAECYDDLSNHIYAVETGLSTDPPMNWMCSSLDNYTLISNSDAHSPEKLGRNANRFNTELSYDAITNALKTGDLNKFMGSIDLFPQEGKYHYDGHRKCGICWDPVETLKHDGICSKCGRSVTVGVMNRVVELSDREDLSLRKIRHPFSSIIPLKELLAELTGVGVNSNKVDQLYMELIGNGIPELELLLDSPVSDIQRIGGQFGTVLAEAIKRMRNREIFIQEGYDGEYGVIKVFDEKEALILNSKNSLFQFSKDGLTENPNRVVPPPRKMINFDLAEYRHLSAIAAERNRGGKERNDEMESKGKSSKGKGLNPEQWEAVQHFTGPCLVIAGPGTGKTHVLTQRIMNLIAEKGVRPENILAVTFTNKAAAEIKERLSADVRVTTFHALGYSILSKYAQLTSNRETVNGFSIIDPQDKKSIIRNLLGKSEGSKARAANFSDAIEEAKQLLMVPDDMEDREVADIYRRYEDYLNVHRLVDLDDLLMGTVKLFEQEPGILEFYRDNFQWILIDEYQDINYAQYRLIRILMPDANSNLCAIGDPDQAIYGFRGADVRYIQRFREDYPEAKVYRLKQSYRCSDSILKASGNIMLRDGSDDTVLKGLNKGIKIKIVKNGTHKSEAEFVARTIEQMIGGLRFFSMDSSITEGHGEGEIESLSDFVVLFRVKSQLEALEKAFIDHSIPYQVVGEEPFFKQEPVASVIDLLCLAHNPGHVILKDKLTEKGDLKSGNSTELADLKELLMEQWKASKESSEDSGAGWTGSVKSLIGAVVERYFPGLREENGEDVKRLELIAENHESLESFLQMTVLGTAVDTYRPNLENVTLMTLHAAKGLEFKAVFIVGCEDGLIPYSLFKNHESDREEERRLLYVGMTRAKTFLFLCHAEKRFLMGQEYTLARSPFLSSIEKRLIEISKQEKKKKDDGPVQRSLF